MTARETPSLEHITFTARPGQTIGIIGGTGSGKIDAGEPDPPVL